MSLHRYNPTSHPVLAFKGAPASFPLKREDRPLQQYIRWNERMNGLAEEYIKHTIGDSPYIGVHLRMEDDWVCFIWHINNYLFPGNNSSCSCFTSLYQINVKLVYTICIQLQLLSYTCSYSAPMNLT